MIELNKNKRMKIKIKIKKKSKKKIPAHWATPFHSSRDWTSEGPGRTGE